MAERRMFAKTIIDSDIFLDLPLSSQALYFHLSMRADDEGFINNPKRILRTIGGSDDDLKLLLAKQFLFSFESGVVVVRHWHIHNYIQKDRFHETQCLEEKAQVKKVNNRYEKVMDTECIQAVSRMDTEVRLGKVSIDNKYLAQKFDEFWKEYPRKQDKKRAFAIFSKLDITEELFDRIMTSLRKQKQSDQWQNERFVPYPSTWLNGKRWDDEMPKGEKQLLERRPTDSDFGLDYLKGD